MTTLKIGWLIFYLAGVWASYICLKDLCALKKVRLLALGSWLVFICYLIACNYNDFENRNNKKNNND